jgi:hypothetical protein
VNEAEILHQLELEDLRHHAIRQRVRELQAVMREGFTRRAKLITQLRDIRRNTPPYSVPEE